MHHAVMASARALIQSSREYVRLAFILRQSARPPVRPSARPPVRPSASHKLTLFFMETCIIVKHFMWREDTLVITLTIQDLRPSYASI